MHLNRVQTQFMYLGVAKPQTGPAVPVQPSAEPRPNFQSGLGFEPGSLGFETELQQHYPHRQRSQASDPSIWTENTRNRKSRRHHPLSSSSLYSLMRTRRTTPARTNVFLT